MSLITIEFFYQNKIAVRSAATLFPTPCGGAGKGDTLFHKREYPPLNPPRERFTLQASSSKSCNACRLHCPDRGVAAFGVARRFGLLLLSAAALPILWECTVISVYRQSLQCGERSNAAFRKQSAAEKTSLAPHDSKARLRPVTTRRDSWRSHVHRLTLRSACSSSSPRPAMETFLSGDLKGDTLFREREYPPFARSPRQVGETKGVHPFCFSKALLPQEFYHPP